MDPLPIATQTAYAELLDALLARDASRSIGDAPGTFTEKEVKGKRYVYFQFSSPGGSVRQVYLGRKSRELDVLVERFAKEREAHRSDEARIEELAAVVRAGGGASIDTASARVIDALERSGVFKLGGVLIGTHAYIVLGNVLGIRFRAPSRTEDIDVVDRVLEIAVPELSSDLPKAIDSLAMGFLPVPAFSPKDPSTSFKVRGKGLRVDLVTQRIGKLRDRPVSIPRLNAAAAPLPYLDYLLVDTIPAALVASSGVLVSVPQPARFAVHKLLVAQERPSAFQAKATKDLSQAATLIDALLELRPADLRLAIAEARRRGRAWTRALAKAPKLLERSHPEVARALVEAR